MYDEFQFFQSFRVFYSTLLMVFKEVLPIYGTDKYLIKRR